MDLERLAVRLRPRSDWEAVDLGLVLVRHGGWQTYSSWLTLTVPVATALILVLGFWGYLIFWWCLPLFEAVALFTLSHAVFGAPPSWAQTLRATPGLWRRAWPELLLRRVHPSRGVRLPVAQLEGLGGQARRQRVDVLGSQSGEVPGLVTLCFLAFELGLVIAIISFLAILTPSWLGIDWELLVDGFFDGELPPWAYRAWWLLVAGVVIVLEPFYVGTGFAVYLNQRTRLEGWDLEIAFRRLARRLGGVPATVAALLLLLWVQPFPGWAVPSEGADSTSAELVQGVVAEEMPAAAWGGEAEQDPRRLVAEVMQLPELQTVEEVESWRLRPDLFGDLLDGDGSNERSFASRRVLEGLVLMVRLGIEYGEVLMWLLGALALVLILRFAWRRLPETRPRGEDVRGMPELLFGLDLRPASLPDDVPAAARDLWFQGQPRAALSLLYRGALACLGGEGLVVRESFTEEDCLSSARSSLLPERAEFFAELTRAWQQVAYAHRLPDAEQAGQLWGRWGQHFGGAL